MFFCSHTSTQTQVFVRFKAKSSGISTALEQIWVDVAFLVSKGQFFLSYEKKAKVTSSREMRKMSRRERSSVLKNIGEASEQLKWIVAKIVIHCNCLYFLFLCFGFLLFCVLCFCVYHLIAMLTGRLIQAPHLLTLQTQSSTM